MMTKMSETERLLSELLLYFRMTAASSARTIAPQILDTSEKADVYSRLDGKTAQSKIESATGVQQRTVSNWIGLFISKGLVSAPNPYSNNHKALFTLDELGIDISALKKKKQKTGLGAGNVADEPAGVS